MEPLINAWRINCRINAYLIESLTLEQWQVVVAKGKSIQSQFAHIHNVRLMWLKAAAPELLEGQMKLDGDLTREEVLAGLESSCEAIAKLLERAAAPEGRVKGFKPDAAAFVCYLTAHESFHRGHAELGLRQAGLPLSDKIAYGQWEWGTR